jgi:hypothetical protein
MRVRQFLPFLLAGCGAAPVAQPAWAPVPLPAARHGHRLEALPGGVLCCGGYGRGDEGTPTRGTERVFWLGDGTRAWQRCADMPVPRAFFGSAADGAGALAIGDGIDRYDLAAGSWRTLVPAGQLPQSHFGAARVGGRVYVLGGYPLECSAFFAVDLATGAVTRQQPPPGFQPGDHFHFLVELQGELHVLGGIEIRPFRARREHWILRGGQWAAEPPPPEGLWAKFGSHANVDGRLHLFGEFGHYVYDPGFRTWTARAPMPFALVMPAVVVRDGVIWIVGGMRVEGEGPVLLAYDPRTDRWLDCAR